MLLVKEQEHFKLHAEGHEHMDMFQVKCLTFSIPFQLSRGYKGQDKQIKIPVPIIDFLRSFQLCSIIIWLIVFFSCKPEKFPYITNFIS